MLIKWIIFRNSNEFSFYTQKPVWFNQQKFDWFNHRLRGRWHRDVEIRDSLSIEYKYSIISNFNSDSERSIDTRVSILLSQYQFL